MFRSRGKLTVIILFAMVLFCSCQTSDNHRNDKSYLWEVQLEAANVSSKGLSLRVMTYSSADEGTIGYGRPYWIEQYQNGEWIPLKTITNGPEYAFSTELNLINVGDTVTIGIDWTPLYGTLEPGTYRLTKVWTYFLDETSEDKSFSVEFQIREE